MKCNGRAVEPPRNRRAGHKRDGETPRGRKSPVATVDRHWRGVATQQFANRGCADFNEGVLGDLSLYRQSRFSAPIDGPSEYRRAGEAAPVTTRRERD
jgi:hypothetical protein